MLIIGARNRRRVVQVDKIEARKSANPVWPVASLNSGNNNNNNNNNTRRKK